MPFNYIGTTRT